MPRRLILLVPLAALVAAGLFVLGRAPRPQPEAQAILTPEDYRRVEGEFVAVLKERGAGAALSALRSRVASDPAVARDCHAIAHTLGHEAYEKAGDFGRALAQTDEICNSGFFHGVIEAHFAGVDDVPAAARTTCAAYRPDTYLGWECYHGIGHGLMFSSANDLPRSVELCEAYDDTTARDNCVNGVYMENFNVERKLHPSSYLKDDDPFFPCDEAGTGHKRECYLYAPTFYLSLHPGRYADALAWCRQAEAGFRIDCIHGVGGQTFKEHPDQPSFVERVCRGGRQDEIEPCIRGMASLAFFHYGDPEQVRVLCGKLERGDRPACLAALKDLEYLYPPAR
ncbi:MAG TPA: hypothetical protein VL283_02935 [Candidatus Baltobacteraceae bacterium]|nr:hypothetical protein [Candidatus Baltobacteraceae bacterium]